MVVTFGAVQDTRWAGRKAAGVSVQLDLLEAPEDSLRSSYKYMFQRLRDIRNGTKLHRITLLISDILELTVCPNPMLTLMNSYIY